ncbi:exodeoxyribonuclease V subunit gamma [Thiolinea disciformis]|uniref:exodeoxyribonuclease V subunit gamma n=1 Tax=Thiolinea disciformis TaxID=125614 RepID=UPI0012FEDBD4|nr:exodeoxyribonuclease V subunit gamma [Thiolinea disciformis]
MSNFCPFFAVKWTFLEPKQSMLHLIHSNRLEALAEQFASLVNSQLLSDPFASEYVIVQNAGMGRWLSLQLAQHNGIAANMKYRFPAELTWELLTKVLQDVPERDPGSPRLLRWRLLSEFQQHALKYRHSLGHYLKAGQDASAWQLAQQIARVFDSYLFFRPDWVKAWESEPQSGWQEQLWHDLIGEKKLYHWIRLQNRFIREWPTAPLDQIPERISFFSIPALSPMYLEMMGQVANRVDVYFFIMNPSELYWGDIETDKRKIRAKPEEQDYITVGNPLLASWGRQGRDFIEILRNNEPYPLESEYFIAPDTDSILHALQTDILYLQGDADNAEVLTTPQGKAWSADGSLALHSCHSPMREVEVLYDQILAALEAEKTLTPADIVVMMPDIEAYAPFIEAIFGAAKVYLPFSIADQRFTTALSLSNACLQLMDLPQQRFEAETVFTLLEYPEIRERFDLDEVQVQQCRDWVRAVNIRWGVDANFRRQFAEQTTFEHTWMYGLDRLLLGYAMPGEQLLGGILPYNEIEGTQAQILERFQHYVRVLFDMAEWSTQRKTLTEWRDAFVVILEQLFPDNAESYLIYQALDTLLTEAKQAEFHNRIAWIVFRDALRRLLETTHQNEGFLGNGITFCTLMPMRSVPFQIVALLGMQDSGFPRQENRLSFDKLAYDSQRKGDRSRRDEDRYLFLESLLAARQRFYISYIGQSVQDNSPSMPSVLVEELLDYLEKRFGLPHAALITQHPLQAFSQRYFQGGELFSYANDYVQLHTNTEYGKQVQPFWNGELLAEPEAQLKHLSLSELISFYRHPARRFLRQLDVAVRETEDELAQREPFSLEAFMDSTLGEQTLKHLQRGGDAEQLLSSIRAQGILPHGKKGELIFEEHYQKVAAIYQKMPIQNALRSLEVNFAWGEFNLFANVQGLSSEGLQVCHFGYTGVWQWIMIWFQHLALNAAPNVQAAYQRCTRVFTEKATYKLGEVPNALQQLEVLVQAYWRGLREPLAFFPKSSWAFVEEGMSFKAAQKVWEGTDYKAGESTQAEYALLYRGRQPIQEQADAFSECSQQVLAGLFAVLEKLE